MLKLLLIICAGAAGGALLGSTRSCETGGCPLTATPLRGAIYGAVIAGLFAFAFIGRPGASRSPAAALSTRLVAVSTKAEFEAQVLQAKGPVVVDFYADWCGPCQQLLPIISELADEWAGSVKVVKVNVDDAREVARDHGVSSIPDLRVFLDGEEKERLVGLQSKATYKARVARYEAAGATPSEPSTPAPIETSVE